MPFWYHYKVTDFTKQLSSRDGQELLRKLRNPSDRADMHNLRKLSLTHSCWGLYRISVRSNDLEPDSQAPFDCGEYSGTVSSDCCDSDTFFNHSILVTCRHQNYFRRQNYFGHHPYLAAPAKPRTKTKVLVEASSTKVTNNITFLSKCGA